MAATTEGAPSPREALRQLAEATAALARAAAAGDLNGAANTLAERQAALEALSRSTASTPLDPGQLLELDNALRQATQVERTLVARRETARALLSELEQQRLHLQKLGPQQPVEPERINVKA